MTSIASPPIDVAIDVIYLSRHLLLSALTLLSPGVYSIDDRHDELAPVNFRSLAIVIRVSMLPCQPGL